MGPNEAKNRSKWVQMSPKTGPNEAKRGPSEVTVRPKRGPSEVTVGIQWGNGPRTRTTGYH